MPEVTLIDNKKITYRIDNEPERKRVVDASPFIDSDGIEFEEVLLSEALENSSFREDTQNKQPKYTRDTDIITFDDGVERTRISEQFFNYQTGFLNATKNSVYDNGKWVETIQVEQYGTGPHQKVEIVHEKGNDGTNRFARHKTDNDGFKVLEYLEYKMDEKGRRALQKYRKGRENMTFQITDLVVMEDPSNAKFIFRGYDLPDGEIERLKKKLGGFEGMTIEHVDYNSADASYLEQYKKDKEFIESRISNFESTSRLNK